MQTLNVFSLVGKFLCVNEVNKIICLYKERVSSKVDTHLTFLDSFLFLSIMPAKIKAAVKRTRDMDIWSVQRRGWRRAREMRERWQWREEKGRHGESRGERGVSA